MDNKNRNNDMKNQHTAVSQTSIIKNNLKFLSWNIQSPATTEGNKFKLEDFTNKMLNHDFVGLQEIRKEVKLPGYRSECNTRKDNMTGGVGILLKNELLEGVEFIKRVDCSDYLICKLKKYFFRQAKDIYLINAYVKPYNSSLGTENNNGKELLEEIGRIIN